MPRPADPWRGRGIAMIAIWFIVACVLLGTGLSNIGHASGLGRHGVTVRATVSQDQGWGRFAVRVSYRTPSGLQQGTLDTSRQAVDYPVGSAITVTYDPHSPSVVTLPGSSSTGGWAEVIAGAAGLLLLASFGGWALLRRRQRGSLQAAGT